MYNPGVTFPFDFFIVTSRPKAEVIGYDFNPYTVNYNPATQLPHNHDFMRARQTDSYCCRERSTGLFNKDDDNAVDDTDYR